MNQFSSSEVISLFKEGGFYNLVLYIIFITLLYALWINYQNTKNFINNSKISAEYKATEEERDKKYTREFTAIQSSISRLDQTIVGFTLTVSQLHTWCMARNSSCSQDNENT